MPHAYSDDALTLARLLQEPVLRRARIHAGRAGAVTRLDWVAPWTDLSAVSTDEALLLADAQTSGGLLVAGEIPGAPVIGELVPRGEYAVVVR